MTREGLHTERDVGDSLLATTDSSIWQQYRTIFCALKHTRSSYKQVIYLDSALPFDASLEAHGKGDVALVDRGGRVRMTWTNAARTCNTYICWLLDYWF